MFGRTMRTPLDELVEMWSGKNKDEEHDVVEYLHLLREWMSVVRELANQKETGEKGKHKQYHDKKATERRFGVGDYVLVFQPWKLDKLHNEWLGPVTVTKKITDVTYEVDMGHGPKIFRTFHINGMKEWYARTAAVFLAVDDNPNEEASEVKEDCHISTLSDHQERELLELRKWFADVISDDPGKTDVVSHDIVIDNATPNRLPPYGLPHTSHEFLRKEIKKLMDLGIITPSRSPWAGPVVLVPKKDSGKRICVDYRKLNLVTKADPYLIPRIEDMINDIGQVSYITALDLTKGYWQVAVAKASQEKTAFVTPWGKYQFVTMPFGLVNAPSTFQCLMDQLLEGTQMFAAAYLDDVIIHSKCWKKHLKHLREILTR